jgi:hypothetical protein
MDVSVRSFLIVLSPALLPRTMSRRKQRKTSRLLSRAQSLIAHYRPLRFKPLEDRRLLSITVNTLIDENDGTGVGDISLRDAIAAAAPGDTINFAPSLTAPGPATILLTHGELSVNKSLTINCPGVDLLAIDASGSDPTPGHHQNYFYGIYDGTRVFDIDDGTSTEQSVSISALKLTGADVDGNGRGFLNNEQLSLTNCEMSGNFASKFGAGITNHGDAVITDCTLMNDSADEHGGGASNTLNLTITATNVFNNRADGPAAFGDVASGGGVYSNGTLDIALSTISGNTSTYGGGIGAGGSGGVSISQSTLTNNSATAGGGAYGSSGSSFVIASSTIHQNNASNSGGALFLQFAGPSLINSTITGNSADRSGAALYIAADQPPVEIGQCTIVSNFGNNSIGGGIFLAAGTLHLSNTIVAKNSASTGPDLTGLIGSSFDASFCLIGDGAKSGFKEAPVGSPDAKGNLVGGAVHDLVDPRLSHRQLDNNRYHHQWKLR